MGRKKKRAAPSPRDRIFCYFCDRNFNTEPELLSHQREKHLRCPTCNKRMLSIPSLSIHISQMHNVTLRAVPNAISGRDSPSLDVLGMGGIPDSYYASLEKAKPKTSDATADDASRPSKLPRLQQKSQHNGDTHHQQQQQQQQHQQHQQHQQYQQQQHQQQQATLHQQVPPGHAQYPYPHQQQQPHIHSAYNHPTHPHNSAPSPYYAHHNPYTHWHTGPHRPPYHGAPPAAPVGPYPPYPPQPPYHHHHNHHHHSGAHYPAPSPYYPNHAYYPQSSHSIPTTGTTTPTTAAATPMTPTTAATTSATPTTSSAPTAHKNSSACPPTSSSSVPPSTVTPAPDTPAPRSTITQQRQHSQTQQHQPPHYCQHYANHYQKQQYNGTANHTPAPPLVPQELRSIPQPPIPSHLLKSTASADGTQPQHEQSQQQATVLPSSSPTSTVTGTPPESSSLPKPKSSAVSATNTPLQCSNSSSISPPANMQSSPTSTMPPRPVPHFSAGSADTTATIPIVGPTFGPSQSTPNAIVGPQQQHVPKQQDRSAQTEVTIVFDRSDLSMEELRAQLPRYALPSE